MIEFQLKPEFYRKERELDSKILNKLEDIYLNRNIPALFYKPGWRKALHRALLPSSEVECPTEKELTDALLLWISHENCHDFVNHFMWRCLVKEKVIGISTNSEYALDSGCPYTLFLLGILLDLGILNPLDNFKIHPGLRGRTYSASTLRIKDDLDLTPLVELYLPANPEELNEDDLETLLHLLPFKGVAETLSGIILNPENIIK